MKRQTLRETLTAGKRCVCCLRPKPERSFPICDDCCKANRKARSK